MQVAPAHRPSILHNAGTIDIDLSRPRQRARHHNGALTRGKNIDCVGIHHRRKPLQQEGAPNKSEQISISTAIAQSPSTLQTQLSLAVSSSLHIT
jgi:hypothetical protein